MTKNILITGGAGFIGSHVARLLAVEYPSYHIVVLDKLDYCASMCNVPIGVEFVRGDVQSFDLVCHVLKRHAIDHVMHFAAQTHVDNSFGNSLAFTLNNTYGTHVLLEACREAGTIKRFVNVSTDEVYGDTSHGAEDGLAEHSILEPTNPYSAAKSGAEMICKSYMHSYGMPIIVTRGNNVYGPGQFPEKLIPRLVVRGLRGRTLPIHGDGSARRSYLYVEDVARAFDIILHKGVDGEVYNIGIDSEKTALDVAKDIAARLSLPSDRIEFVRDRAFNDTRYYIGSQKLHALGWTPRVGWEEGLSRTIEWYKNIVPEAYWGWKVSHALEPHPKN